MNITENALRLVPHRMVEEKIEDTSHFQEKLKNAESILIRTYLHQVSGKEGFSMKDFMNQIEKRLLLLTLALCSGKQKKAAEVLNVKATTLHEKMKKHRIRTGHLSFEDEQLLETLDFLSPCP